MTTGPITSFAGNITEIGPMYPFVGSEMLMTLLLAAFYVIWTLWQLRAETKTYVHEMEEYGDQVSMTTILKGEKLYQKLDHFGSD